MLYFQKKTMNPPAIIPAVAPYLLERLQKSARRTTGPKEAPKPAHAKDTIWKTELSGFHAIPMERPAIIKRQTRATYRSCFSSR